MCLSLGLKEYIVGEFVLINKWKCYYKLQNVSVARVEGIHSWRVVLINKWKCYYKLQNVSVARVEGIHSWRVVHINKWKCYYKL